MGFGRFAYLAFSRKHDNKQIIVAKVLITVILSHPDIDDSRDILL
jgi:hypothetical protein